MTQRRLRRVPKRRGRSRVDYFPTMTIPAELTTKVFQKDSPTHAWMGQSRRQFHLTIWAQVWQYQL